MTGSAPAVELEIDPSPFLAVWRAALSLYVEDCAAALHGTQPRMRADRSVADDALADLLTDQVQLRHMCDVLELDADYAAARIMQHIEAAPTGRYRNS